MRLVATRLLGTVDRVPGRFCVATEFVVCCGWPTKPLGSWVVADAGRLPKTVEDASWAVLIPTSRRSLFVAYAWPVCHLVRLCCLASTVAGMVAVAVQIRGGGANPNPILRELLLVAVGLAVSVGCVLPVVYLRMASPTADRLVELEQLARTGQRRKLRNRLRRQLPSGVAPRYLNLGIIEGENELFRDRPLQIVGGVYIPPEADDVEVIRLLDLARQQSVASPTPN